MEFILNLISSIYLIFTIGVYFYAGKKETKNEIENQFINVLIIITVIIIISLWQIFPVIIDHIIIAYMILAAIAHLFSSFEKDATQIDKFYAYLYVVFDMIVILSITIGR